MSEIEIFNFNGASVRTVLIDGEPWWVAKDVCDVLEIVNPSDALSKLDDGDRSNTLVSTEGIRGNPNRAIINESGLYDLILDSRKPQAKAFRKWVTSEVIPSIRKTGSYSAKPMSEIEMARNYVAALESLEAAKPALAFHSAVVADEESWLSMERVSKEVHAATGMGRNTLINWMKGKGYLTQANLPAQRLINSGKARVTLTIAPNGKGYQHSMFTQAGVEWLLRKFLSDNDKD